MHILALQEEIHGHRTPKDDLKKEVGINLLNLLVMKKLESFENVRLDLNETMKIRGNGFWSDYLWGKVLEYSIKIALHDPEQYGRRMYETGSPGGHK